MGPHYVIGLVTLGSLVAMVTGQAGSPQSQCQLRFLQSATACMQNASLNIQNVQYVASNGTSGQPPSENLQSYRQRVCVVKPQLDICGQSVTQRLINSTLCLNPVDRQSILSSFQTTFGGLDTNCAQPCRYTLMDELRQCYSFVNLQPTMISDLALVKQAVIGQNYDQVNKFCIPAHTVKFSGRRYCPDTNPVARKLYNCVEEDLQRTAAFIAETIYLAGLHCFKNPIPEVRMCFQTLNRKMQNLRLVAPQPTVDQVSLAQFCSIRLEQIDCEMGAWARHQYQTCERVFTGIRNELSCKLLPDRCSAAYPQLVNNLCNPLNYFLEDRSRYNGAGHAGTSLLSLVLMLFLSVVLLHK
ncbi:uncharacterized protein LOC143287193 [Babylonia areolata]|uniref:uncharacterized protein LOC143287193 n=1 Tax=Babylonia areolata TaxID=304850 RepID=UPI003FD0FF80